MASNLIAAGDGGVILEQAVHGYRDGHRLLGSSRRFSSDTNRTLLLLTDLSGPQIASFDGYISAYGLPDDGLYAYSKTWYAYEISRPGCVWTHTLFLSEHDLLTLSDLSHLNRLFRRPDDGALESYLAPITLGPLEHVARNETLPIVGDDDPSAADMISAVFDDSDRGILVPADNAEDHVELFTGIWSSMWMELRRSFSFCTGATEPRMKHGRPFDIQAVPRLLANQYERRRSQKFNVLANRNWSRVDFEWISAVQRAMAEPSGFHRFFIAKLGTTLEPKRTSMRIAAQFATSSIDVANGRTKLDVLLQGLSEVFPSREEGRAVKSLLLDPLESPWTPIGDPELLEALITSDVSDSFEADTLSLTKRGLRLYSEDRPRALKLLAVASHPPISALNAEYVDLIVNQISHDGDALHELPQTLLPLVVAHKPSILGTIDTTSLDLETRLSLVEATLSLDVIDTDVLIAVVEFELQNGLARFANQLVERAPRVVAATILSWVETADSDTLPYQWRLLLSSQPEACVQALEDSPIRSQRQLEFIAGLLQNHRAISVPERDAWKRLLRSRHAVEAMQSISVLALVTGLMDNADSSLILDTIEYVHGLIERDSLRSWEWRHLENRVPILFYWDNWDKARRVRIAVGNHYIENRWPLKPLFDVLHDQKLRKDFRKTIESDVWGSRDAIREFKTSQVKSE